MRVLVADQEADHRASLVNYIQTLGHTVQEALTERDVLDQCRGKCPELLFIDSELSGISGLELVRQIRLLGGHAIWAPIVLMSKVFEEQQMRLGVEAGTDDLLIKPIPAVRALAKVRSAERLVNLKEEVFTVAHNLVIANRALENIATQDVLTGIGNSNTFDDDLERYWFDAKRNNAPLTIIMTNLDYFQAYNQSYGAAKGDDAIKRAAEILKSALPKGESSLARIAGETFSILLPNTSKEEGMKAAEDLRAAIDAAEIPHINSGCSDHLTASFGVSMAEPGRYTSPWDLKEAVDFALYQAKHHGRNRSYFVPTADANANKAAGKSNYA
jgi:diguanylate cyclase (GGDEF)-like protein